MSRKPRPCAKCPVWRPNWCAHLAKPMMPCAPSCEWGRRQMNSRYCVEYNRRKYGWQPRKRKSGDGA